MLTHYPLCYPNHLPRTKHPQRSSFKVLLPEAKRHLDKQLELLGAKKVILSANVNLHQTYSKLPKVGEIRGRLYDVGVACYFEWEGKQRVIACDKWDTIACNVRAIGKTIESIRAITRYECSDILNAVFTGLTALPAPLSCWEILGVGLDTDLETIKHVYKQLCKRYHPDTGGNLTEFQRINEAYQEVLRILNN
jgi:hypothetical protein